MTRQWRGILRLLGLLLAPVVLHAQVQTTPQGVLLDFQDADLRFVITALAEAGNINVIYGDLPQRRVTLRMKQPLSREGLMPLLRSLAQSNGLRVTETADFMRLEAGTSSSAPPADSSRTPAASLRLVVYRLKHAKASQLAGTLQNIFGGGRGDASPGLRPVPLSEGLHDNIPPAPGTDSGLGQTTRVDVELGQSRPVIPGQLRGQVQVVPDELTNALIVRAQPADWEILKQTIEQLDVRPLQVLIEVVIAEVKRTNESGISASGTAKQTRGKTRIDGSLDDTKSARSVLFHLLSGGAVNLDLALSALASRGDVRILSRPVIMAQNNQEARILIGSERPFIQASRSLPTDAGVRDQVIQYRDVGTKLTIVPTINEDGYVNLQVLQEVSTATAEVQFGAPVISTREASTRLFIRDGQTAVIGGLIDRQQEKSRSGIPGLMDIPILGALFGTTRNSTTNNELFLFLTPHLISTDADIDRTREGIRTEAPLLKDMVPGSVAADSATGSRKP